MNTVAEQKPTSIYIPYALLVAALFSVFILALNKVDLRPGEVEYPAEAFIAPEFELPSLLEVKLSSQTIEGKSYLLIFGLPGAPLAK